MRNYLLFDKVLDEDELGSLQEAALGSHHVGNSPLKGTFDGSRGFGLSFRRDALGDVALQFPYLKTFLTRCLSRNESKGLWTFSEKMERWFCGWGVNAFYLNLLWIPPHKSITAHVDATLNSLLPMQDHLPMMVSVLYVNYPKGATGGELCILKQEQDIATIKPMPGRLVHFRGDLTHCVRAFEPPNDLPQPRISLVLEHYCLPEDILELMPALKTNTPGLFSKALKEARNRPIPKMDIDLPDGRVVSSHELLSDKISKEPK
jgi:hypothetical protein